MDETSFTIKDFEADIQKNYEKVQSVFQQEGLNSCLNNMKKFIENKQSSIELVKLYNRNANGSANNQGAKVGIYLIFIESDSYDNFITKYKNFESKGKRPRVSEGNLSPVIHPFSGVNYILLYCGKAIDGVNSRIKQHFEKPGNNNTYAMRINELFDETDSEQSSIRQKIKICTIATGQKTICTELFFTWAEKYIHSKFKPRIGSSR